MVPVAHWWVTACYLKATDQVGKSSGSGGAHSFEACLYHSSATWSLGRPGSLSKPQCPLPHYQHPPPQVVVKWMRCSLWVVVRIWQMIHLFLLLQPWQGMRGDSLAQGILRAAASHLRSEGRLGLLWLLYSEAEDPETLAGGLGSQAQGRREK